MVRFKLCFLELKEELKSRNPHLIYSISQFMDVRYKNSTNGRLFVKYVLSNINDYLFDTNELIIDFYNVNLEHVLPQRPSKAWGLTTSDIRGFVNLLGNLTLVDKKINSKIGNDVISVKLPELEKSNLEITKQLVRKLHQDQNWNKYRITKRQEELGVIAYKEIWKF